MRDKRIQTYISRAKRFLAVGLMVLITAAVAVFMLMPSLADQTACYVTQAGSGDFSGSGWENAMGQSGFVASMDALSATGTSGDTYIFFLQHGVYALTKTLPLPKNVKLYGGFKGTESSSADRDLTNAMKYPMSGDDYATVLSRDADKWVSSADGTIVMCSADSAENGATSADTRLDGFTITGGTGTWSDRRPAGETVADTCCDGGGMYNNFSSPYVANCTFSGNRAQNYASADVDSNYSNGGGMFNLHSSPYVANCVFSKNIAIASHARIPYKRPGGTAVHGSARCYGGGMNNEHSSPDVVDCTFIGNIVSSDVPTSYDYDHCEGGGMYNYYSGPTVANCAFNGNKVFSCSIYYNLGFSESIAAYSNGGGMSSGVSSIAVSNCVFSGNSASAFVSGGTCASKGGAMSSSQCDITVTNCTFSGNSASSHGSIIGGHSCTSNSYGGAVYNLRCSQTIANCTFSGNSASAFVSGGTCASQGGAVYNLECSPTIANCTFSGNSATVSGSAARVYNYGGGMFNDGGSPAVVNSIFWGDSADGGGDEICSSGCGYISSGTPVKSAPIVKHCVVKSNSIVDMDYASTASSDITSADPYLGSLSDNGGHVQTMQISAGGSAFRAGMDPGADIISSDNSTVLAQVPSDDARGARRIAGVSADIGAYAWRSSGSLDISVSANDAMELEIGETRDIVVTANSPCYPLSTDVPDSNIWRLAFLTSIKSPDIASLSGVAVTGKKRGETVVDLKSNGKVNIYDDNGDVSVTLANDVQCRVKVRAKSSPAAEVTSDTRTDAAGVLSEASGIIVVSKETEEDFAIYDGFADISFDGKLPSGISVESLDAVNANSADISTDAELYASGDVKKAIEKYWNVTDDSGETVSLIKMQNTVASSSDGTIWAKYWGMVRSFVANLFGIESTDGKYLPLQTNFKVASADLPPVLRYALSEKTTSSDITKYFLENAALFAVVQSNDSDSTNLAARSLYGAASPDITDYAEVSRDADGCYTVKTKVLLFNMEGGVKTDAASGDGAAFVQPFKSDGGGNYFIVQDGCATDDYKLCMAFAAKEPKDGACRVTAGGAGSRSGINWANAIDKDALTATLDYIANSSEGTKYEFWVKKGQYDLKKTLKLTKGVKLYGGFKGTDDSETVETRDISADRTILSRDAEAGNMSIVTCSADSTANGAASDDTRLDGFTITGGTGTQDGNFFNGGGMYNKNSSPTVANCTFSENKNYGRNCYGGGMYNKKSSPAVTNCTFSGNEACDAGGGMMNYDGSSPAVTNCTFNSNISFSGACIRNWESSPVVTNCTFSENIAKSSSGQQGDGGAINNYKSGPVVINCTFSKNSANNGGGMYSSDSSSPTMLNCTFSDNSGSGMYFWEQSGVVAVNSIFWDNGTPEIYKNGGSHKFQNCVIKDLSITAGNNTTLSAVTSGDPYLGALADNGGPVQTIQISAGGSAFRAGLAPGTQVKTGVYVPSADARGAAFNSTSADIGAYSWQYGSGGVKLTPASANIEREQTTTVSSADSDLKPLSSDIDTNAWRAITAIVSSNPTVASISGSTITAVARGKATFISAVKNAVFSVEQFAVYVTGKTAPKGEVTQTTRTDNADGVTLADASGVVVVSKDTIEDFAICDGFDALSEDGSLPSGITVTSLDAIQATSVDIATSKDIYGSADVRQAIANYWGLGTESQDKVRLVEVSNTVGTKTDAPETLWAKFWRLLKSFVTGQFAGDADSKYLPLQTNFTITSEQIASLPDYVKTGLTENNLLASVDLFVVVSGDDGTAHARSLHDIVSADSEEAKFITVSGDNDNGYTIKTRVLLFNMEGTVSTDLKPGAKWVQKFWAISTDQTTSKDKDNYFIVQDGKDDENYDLCMAFACKETNYAAVNVTISGDIPTASKDVCGWTISGDKYKIPGTGTRRVTVSEDSYEISLDEYYGYRLEISGETSRDLKLGETWNVEAEYRQIYVDSVSLDKSVLSLFVGSTDVTLTATVLPDDALVKDVSWSVSGDAATVDQSGDVTPVKVGTAVITATTADGGKTASCDVKVTGRAANFTITPVSIPNQTYTGSAITPSVAVKDGETTLTKDADYTVSYSDNTNAGTAKVTVAGKGNYTGTKTVNFTINSAAVTFTITGVTDRKYTGSAITQTLTVTSGDKLLAAGTDYTVAYNDNTNVGTARVTVTGKGNYSGSAETTFKITEKAAQLTIDPIPDQTYTGSGLKPALTVKDGTTLLKSGTDYTAAYSNNTSVGTATVDVTCKGNYSGNKSATFRIVRHNWAASADTAWYNTGSTSFTITTEEQLAGLAALVNSGSDDMTGKTVAISGDLDLSGADWTPIGTKGNPFNGTFDGGGSTVTNLVISDDTKDDVGFIGVTGIDATVKDVTVSGDVSGKDNIGVLVGTNNGTITNCTTDGTTSGAVNVGGITGVNNGTVASSVSEAEATAETNAGGVAGKNTGTISNATSTGTTTAEGADGTAGGIAGTNAGGIITDSTAAGVTSGDAATTGGIAGTNTGNITDSNWVTDTSQPGTGTSSDKPVSGDCKDYTTVTSGDMLITTVTLRITNITTDENGGFWITAEAYPNTAKNRTLKLIVKNFEAAMAKTWTFTKAAWAEGTLTLTPDTIEADGEPHYIQTTGDKGKYTIGADRAADSKELAKFTLNNTKQEETTSEDNTGSSGGGGCSAGAGALALLLCGLAARRRK